MPEPEHAPTIEPCEHGNFKLSCSCGWRIHPRFTTVTEAERFWATNHAAQFVDEEPG